MPMINSITDLFISGIEVLKSYLSIIIVNNNKKIETKPGARPIGFQYVEEEDLDYEEDL